MKLKLKRLHVFYISIHYNHLLSLYTLLVIVFAYSVQLNPPAAIQIAQITLVGEAHKAS